MKIAYQGEPGAFSEAASRLVSSDASLIPCKSFEEVFASVEQGPAQYGVLPIENSIGGSIHRNYDLLMENHLPIVGEVEVPVVHHLLALPGAALSAIKRVYSHPQALAQCERFLRTLSGVEIIATYDTAGSAKMVRTASSPTRPPSRRHAPAKFSASRRSRRRFRTSATTSRGSSSSAGGR